MNNLLANQTFQYIWTHPNCKNNRIESILKFIQWQFYKRITQRFVDVPLVPGIKVRCYPDNASASSVLYCGLYDFNEMNFLLRYLRSEDSFIDIGANIGVYTLLAASRIKSGTILSFKALPKNYKRLEENIKLNQIKNVKTHCLAVSDRNGSIEFDTSGGDLMSSISFEKTSRSISVPTDTLDNLLAGSDLNITVGKMDIEGAEFLALRGANLLLNQKKPPVWILEINSSVHRFGHQKQDVVNLLTQYGYSLYNYNSDANQLQPISLSEQNGNNVIAIADSELSSIAARLSLAQF